MTTRRSLLNFFCVGTRTLDLPCGRASVCRLHSSPPPPPPVSGFRPSKVAVVAKTTRYEFEQQRYRFAGLSELAMKGSSYSGLLERHNIHTRNMEHIVERRKVLRCAWCTEENIMKKLSNGQTPSFRQEVFSKDKPIVGVNTDPERSEGHLCLPVRYTHAFPEALERLRRGEFSLEQHNQAHRLTTLESRRETGRRDENFSEPNLLPVRSLNEIFIGESLSSRASYYEISVDDGPSNNINRLVEQAVEDVLKIVTEEYNQSLVFSPADRRLFFSVREPIVNRVFSSTRQRGFAKKVCVRSRCWDACMVVDGGTSFEFNDGAIATISMSEEDHLRTVLL
ncbi:hypothetical protein CRUP_003266 [Coryphaenoides rupestris]|nr:hypothetical protein CRUP_003266 [Coryphaenoides rupestris]